MESTTKLRALGRGENEECIIEFTETGYTVLKNTCKDSCGYLHIYEESAEQITEACRNQIIAYIFNHKVGKENGLGATPQDRYFKGISRTELEKIGNKGKKAYYNR